MTPYEYVLEKEPECTERQFNEAFAKLQEKYQDALLYPETAEKSLLRYAREKLLNFVKLIIKGQEIKLPFKEITIYEYAESRCPNCSRDQVDHSFRCLRKEYQDALLNPKTCGEAALIPAQFQFIQNIKNVMAGKKINPPKGLSLYEYVLFYYPECTREQFDRAINKLDRERINKLKKLYGENLDTFLNGLTKREVKDAANARKQLLNRASKIISEPKRINIIENNSESKNKANSSQASYTYTLFHYLNGVDRKTVDTLKKALMPAVQCKIMHFWGSDYQSPKTSLHEHEIHERKMTIYVLKLLLIGEKTNNEEQLSEWNRLAILFNTESCLAHIRMLHVEYQLLIKAKLGWFNGRIYSVDELSEAFNTEKPIIIKILDQIIHDLRECLIQDQEIKEKASLM